MSIKQNDVVSIHYTLKNDAGEVLDSSEGRGPLEFIQGAGSIIPGLEDAMVDKAEGENFNVTIAPEDAYGEYSESMVQQVNVDEMKGIDNVEAGMQLQAQTEQGPIPIVVKSVEEGVATLDANHPLAGETLHFDVTVDGIRQATEEEIQNGQVAQAEAEQE